MKIFGVLLVILCSGGTLTARNEFSKKLIEDSLSGRVIDTHLELSRSLKNDLLELKRFKTGPNGPLIEARILHETWQDKQDSFIADLRVINRSDIPRILAFSSIEDFKKMIKSPSEFDGAIPARGDLATVVHLGWVALSPGETLIIVLQAIKIVGPIPEAPKAQMQVIKTQITEMPLP